MEPTAVSDTQEEKRLLAEIKETLTGFIDSLHDFHLDFLFEPGSRLNDLKTIKDQSRESLLCLKTSLEYSDEAKSFIKKLYNLLTDKHFDLALQVDELEQLIRKIAEKPDDEIENRLLSADTLWSVFDPEVMETECSRTGDDSEMIVHMTRLLDFTLAYMMHKLVSERVEGNYSSHPQNLRHILSVFSEKTPEILLILGSALKIIRGGNKFAIEERGRTSRTLIRNYRFEELYIHIATDQNIPEEEKSFIFSWLTAFKKVYRKIQEILYEKKEVKSKIAQVWYNLKEGEEGKDDLPIRSDTQLSGDIRQFIDHVLSDNSKEFWATGKQLVSGVYSEDLLRWIHMILHQNDNTALSLESREKIYHSIYSIMNAYRKICTQMNVEHPQLKTMFSSISRDRRVAETILTHAPISENKSPILGSRSVHPLLDETKRNLKESNLTHLFEIWPIPETSQKLFNEICRLKFMIPQESDYIINHFLYREKFLEFLMRLDRVGIKVNKNPHLPLITNAYQLDTLGFFREGAYLGSTGHWKAQIQKPPSVICCTNPHALGNCVGQPLRHIVMRVFLGTGEFYESPFILDSTLRYGQMDEEGGIQALFMRPGLFIIDVPSAIEEHWKNVQSHQIKTKLGDIIKEKIRVEN